MWRLRLGLRTNRRGGGSPTEIFRNWKKYLFSWYDGKESWTERGVSSLTQIHRLNHSDFIHPGSALKTLVASRLWLTRIYLYIGINFLNLNEKKFMSDEPTERPGAPERETKAPMAGVKRPLVPLVLALMLGLAAAAWGVNIAEFWLVAGLAALLAVMFLGFFCTGFKESRRRSNKQP
jgi:hypothetical protein